MELNIRTFYIESLGCITNNVDAAKVQEFFKANGWTKVDSSVNASLIVLMTCGFTKASEDYNIWRLEELKQTKRPDAQIIVGGCLPSINKDRLREIFDGFVFSPRTLSKLDDFIASEIRIDNISPSVVEQDNHMTAIRISTGCMSHCTYCAIPYANGRTKSRSLNEIILDVSESIEQGIRKIKFVSEDVGAYGQEQNLSIIDLLEGVLKSGIDFELYLDNLNPNWLYRYKSELLELFHSTRIAKSMNIPIQSGSDRILDLMKREYTISEVHNTLRSLYEKFPSLRISTDFIVGFPTESEEDFEASRNLLKAYPFHHVEIFTYEDRPRIEALRLEPKIADKVKEERRQALFQEFLKKFLSSNNVSNSDQLKLLLETYEKIPVNFNLVLV
jgi:MiaB/RimO family radical SAM methylthiotransferase